MINYIKDQLTLDMKVAETVYEHALWALAPRSEEHTSELQSL